jgi:Cytidine and deoxycytidylate deaminase zinc-binding region
VAGALAGAAMEAGMELASQLIDNGGNIDCLDWGDVTSSGIDGAISGGLTGPLGKAVTGLKGLRHVAKGGKGFSKEKVTNLMLRDEDGHLRHGQRVADTFHLADFFVRLDGNNDVLKNGIWRILDILFGNPYKTPTFDEYAMFLAFAAALRSADLSRQVGAVIAKNTEIIATGANDCPRFGGGLYWPEFDGPDQGQARWEGLHAR